jgi:tetratricopeptide (TPR) repeat protein
MTKKKPTATAEKTSPLPKPASSPVGQPIAQPVGQPVSKDSPSAAVLQLRTWEQAMRLFGQRRFAEARDQFSVVASGPDSQVADKARSYLQICERKVARPELEFRTAEDHFNYGVERMNARDIEQARLHLGRALGIEPEGDHILYTLALCCGLAGDGNGACENLKRAITLEPRNRILARQDPEFSTLAAQFPALRALLGNDGV